MVVVFEDNLARLSVRSLFVALFISTLRTVEEISKLLSGQYVDQYRFPDLTLRELEQDLGADLAIILALALPQQDHNH